MEQVCSRSLFPGRSITLHHRGQTETNQRLLSVCEPTRSRGGEENGEHRKQKLPPPPPERRKEDEDEDERKHGSDMEEEEVETPE